MKLRIFFILFFSILFFRNVYADTIKSIEILGSNSISRGTVLSYLPIEVNDEYTNDLSNEILKSLYRTDFFKNISIEFKDQVLQINLEENPAIKFIEFNDYDEGNDVLSEEVVTSIIKNANIGLGKIYSKKTLTEVINQLYELYKSKGFYNVIIDQKTEIDEKNRISIELSFNEGERALIKSLKIKNTNYFDEDYLKSIFEIGEPDFFVINFFTKKDHYSDVQFDAGIEKLIKKYVDEGFLEFEILDKKTSFNTNKTEINIEIYVKEGSRYVVDNVLFQGDIDENITRDLKKIIKTKHGDYVKRKVILDDMKKLNSYFTDKGFAYSRINTNFVPLQDSNKLNVIATVDKSERFYINRIDISGNTRTQDSVIRREMNITEGQVYSKADIDKSITRIKRIGYFSKVKHSVKRIVDSNKIDLFIEVTETKTGEFAVGLSHSNSSGASLNASIEQRNILGTGNTLNASFRNSKAIEETSFFFSNPFFNQDKHSLSYGFYTKSLDASNLDISSYLIDENGLSLGYGVPLSDSSKINAETKLSDLKITCGTVFASSGYEPIQCASNDSLMNTLQFSYSKNTLNDFYSPTDGTKTNLDFVLTTPLSDFKYLSMGVSHKSYSPLNEDLTFNFLSKINLATGLGGNELPFFKRYFGGGSSSVRGFDFNSLGAKYANGNPKGGESSILSSISLIAPANSLGIDQENIRFQTFFDVGSINEKLSDFNLDELRSSTGVALSWLTPIGPIGFYAATPIMKKDNDSIETFAFELGTTF